MKTVTIKAYQGKGEDKVFCGEQEQDLPETIAELVENFDDAEVLACFIYGFKVKIQQQLRTPTSSPTVNEFKKYSKADQDEALRLLRLAKESK